MRKYIFISVILISFFFPQAVRASAPTLNDYWQGKARWQFVFRLTDSGTGWGWGFEGGTRMVVVGSTWYLFTSDSNGQPSYCPGGSTALVVRKSTDQGKTWSDKVRVISPQEGKPWECFAVDGGVYYNATENKWHYVFQCLARNGVWNGCYLEKIGSDPMGLFSEPATIGFANPVIPSGSLWSRICSNPNSNCAKLSGGNVGGEGTFDIFYFDGTYYYVSFHGYDNVRGYRGIAKTKDFINWIAGDVSQGVPNDAFLTLYDQLNWRETWDKNGPIGFGEASTLYENGYFYTISEGMDINLGGEYWPRINVDFGIFRSNSLINTKWEQFPLGNPILYSGKGALARGYAYGNLFKVPTTQNIYAFYSILIYDSNANGIYFYQLVPNNNLLQNSDVWKCSTENWSKISPATNTTNLTASRVLEKSSDYNCYLAANCGASSCEAGQSVYQDVSVEGISSRTISYGGKFAVDSGTGSISLALFEFDSGGNVITSHGLPVNLTSDYQLFKQQVQLNNQTKKVRFQFYLATPNTVKADEMFVEPESIIPGDLNSDGRVDILDLRQLLGSFTSIFDYNNLVGNFGK